jgi:5'-nucleotidase
MLSPSAGFAFSFDPARPAGERIVVASLDGKAIDPASSYRVVSNSFMASGGDNYGVLTQGTDRRDVGIDLDALESYLAAGKLQPLGGRLRNIGPPQTGK